MIFHDTRCAAYGSPMRPEQPARVLRSGAHLRAAHPEWGWRQPEMPAEATLLATYRKLPPKYQRRLREQAEEFETLARATRSKKKS